MEKVTIRGETFYLLPEEKLSQLQVNVNLFLDELIPEDTKQASQEVQFWTTGQEKKRWPHYTRVTAHVGRQPKEAFCGATTKKPMKPLGRDLGGRDEYIVCGNCRYTSKAQKYLRGDNRRIFVDFGK